jgi:Electron transfer DM13
MLSTLRRPVVLVPVVLVGIAVIAAGLLAFQPWRLFTNVTVDEALPTVSAPASVASSAATPGTPEGQLTSEPVALASGELISHEHGTSGTVRILELPDGSRVLRIEDLDTDNGPDLKVWLTDASVIDGPNGWFVFDDGQYADLGSLKGNKGSQNYAIPADVDLAELTSLTIWCDRFNVSFGAAALTPA